MGLILGYFSPFYIFGIGKGSKISFSLFFILLIRIKVIGVGLSDKIYRFLFIGQVLPKNYVMTLHKGQKWSIKLNITPTVK